MKALGYKMIKGRGICFIDDKKVKIKGSEVGFSLMKIEQILALKQELALRQKENLQRQQPDGTKPHTSSHRLSINPFPRSEGKPAPVIRTEKQITSLLSKLLEPVPQMGGAEPYELTEEYLKRKRKRPKISH